MSVLNKKGLMLNSPNVHRSPPHWQCMLEINRSSMVTMPLGWNGFPSSSLGVNYAIIHSPFLGKFNLVLALPSGVRVLSWLVPLFCTSLQIIFLRAPLTNQRLWGSHILLPVLAEGKAAPSHEHSGWRIWRPQGLLPMCFQVLTSPGGGGLSWLFWGMGDWQVLEVGRMGRC